MEISPSLSLRSSLASGLLRTHLPRPPLQLASHPSWTSASSCYSTTSCPFPFGEDAWPGQPLQVDPVLPSLPLVSLTDSDPQPPSTTPPGHLHDPRTGDTNRSPLQHPPSFSSPVETQVVSNKKEAVPASKAAPGRCPIYPLWNPHAPEASVVPAHTCPCSPRHWSPRRCHANAFPDHQRTLGDAKALETKGVVPKPRRTLHMPCSCIHRRMYPIKHLQLTVGTPEF
jgi:hypothetical protein